MIDLLAGIATILGFTMQVYDKFSDKESEKEELNDTTLLLFLKELSVKSKAIKEIHQKYHSLSGDMRPVATFLSNPYTYGKIEVKQRELRNELKKALQGPSAIVAQNHLSADLQSNFEELKINSKDKDVLLGAINSLNDCEIKAPLRKIINAQFYIETLHNGFCDTMQKVGRFSRGDWGESEFSFILTNHRIFTSDFYQIIDSADIILMGYLDIYHYIANSKSQIS